MRKKTWAEALILSSILILYIGLFFYGRVAIIPRNKALTLINEADTIFYYTTYTDRPEMIKAYKQYVFLYGQANAINLKQYPFLGDFPILEGYIRESYKLGKALVSYEEDLQNGKIPYTEGDYEKRNDEFVIRFKEVRARYGSYGRTHLWMRLVFLK